MLGCVQQTLTCSHTPLSVSLDTRKRCECASADSQAQHRAHVHLTCVQVCTTLTRACVCADPCADAGADSRTTGLNAYAPPLIEDVCDADQGLCLF
jgi:hypothetical protein